MATGDDYQESLQSAMLALSQNFITASDDVAATLGRVTQSAGELIDGVDYADVMLMAFAIARGGTDLRQYQRSRRCPAYQRR